MLNVMKTRRLRWVVWALGAWAMLWLLVWLAVPPLLTWQLPSRLQDFLDRPVAVESVRFQPWSMQLEVRGLQVGQPQDTVGGQPTSPSEPVLRLGLLRVNVELQSLLRWAPVVDALEVDGLRLTVRHLGDGRHDIDDILARFQRTPEQSPSPMPRFAVFNVAVNAPALTWIDEPAGVTHRVEDLSLRVPFLSNIGARREIATEPVLSFLLNGRPFQTEASTTPFAEARHTEAALRIDGLDLAPYLPYWPAAWSVRPASGTLDASLRVAFEMQDAPKVSVQGELGLSQLRVLEMTRGEGHPLVNLPELDITLLPSEPLAQRWHIGDVAVQGLEVWARRDEQGGINWSRLATSPPGTTGDTEPSPTEAPEKPLAWRVDRVHWQDVAVHWEDASTQPMAQWTWQAIQTEVLGLQSPTMDVARIQGSATWSGAPVGWQGTWGPQGLLLDLSMQEWPIETLAPYVAAFVKPALTGSLNVASTLSWSPGADGGLTWRASELALNNLLLGTAREPLVRLQALGLTDASVQWPQAMATVGRLSVSGLQTTLRRDAQGRWQHATWTAQAPTGTVSGDGVPAQNAEPVSWQVRLDAVELAQGRVDWVDESTPDPVRWRLEALNASLTGLAPTASTQADMPLSVRFRMLALDERLRPAAQTGGGTLQWAGRLRLPAADGAADRPWRVAGRVQAERLPLHTVVPYAGPSLKMDVLRADTSVRGELAIAGGQALTLRFQGDLAVDDFSAQSVDPRADLLDWNSLTLRGIDVAVQPDEPLRLAVAETVLSDYFARVLVSEQGRLNLLDLWQTAPSPADVPSASSPNTDTVSAGPTPSPAVIRFGPVSLVNGRVDFSDRFIQPNYSARISELTGSLGAFSSGVTVSSAPDGGMAELSLRGRVEGTATLEVSGRLRPLASPLTIDIAGRVRDLELPPLSPYSTKFAGHGIERGKLSMDVRYQIDTDGRLQASNQIILNQLTFGERDADSQAPNLPVRLAVALLADRNGVIDIQLPVSGSINDPEFRLGSIIVRVIFNLIAKAVTAPFSLLANALSGGGEEMSALAFEPGRPAVEATSVERLERVAGLLRDRPALSVTVVGHASVEAEAEAYRRAQLDERIRAEKRRTMARQGQALEEPVVVGPDEYPSLLKSLYQRTDIPKPRNLIGLAKDIPVQDMEKLLLTAIPAPEQAMRDLALARSVSVKDRLVTLGVEPARVFLGAPVLNAALAAGTPAARAELQLAPR